MNKITTTNFFPETICPTLLWRANLFSGAHLLHTVMAGKPFPGDHLPYAVMAGKPFPGDHLLHTVMAGNDPPSPIQKAGSFCHSGLDPESLIAKAGVYRSEIPRQARDDRGGGRTEEAGGQGTGGQGGRGRKGLRMEGQRG